MITKMMINGNLLFLIIYIAVSERKEKKSKVK